MSAHLNEVHNIQDEVFKDTIFRAEIKSKLQLGITHTITDGNSVRGMIRCALAGCNFHYKIGSGSGGSKLDRIGEHVHYHNRLKEKGKSCIREKEARDIFQPFIGVELLTSREIGGVCFPCPDCPIEPFAQYVQYSLV